MNVSTNDPSFQLNRQEAELDALRHVYARLGELLSATEAVIKAREADLQSNPICAACGKEARVTVDGYGLFCAKCLEPEKNQ